ncbi:hypothetical protein HPT25_27690 [Bacillus sp. BRMEA1]|uniref:hypothetical protein n=1 Tax=Neobacillus endophyticus TaxID=2738405 RepID=UPI001564B1B3|nr:hypothetical protein [Neobacillus endophyticus]NRD81079.1 hypothetical protein [Neobacillus endophyticus]
MNYLLKLFIPLFCISIILVQPNPGFADQNGVPSFVPKSNMNGQSIQKKDFHSTMGSWMGDMDGILPQVYDTGMKFITIMFIIAVIALALSLIFKNGKWTKWSTGVMGTTLLIILFFRAGPIIMLTTNTIGVTLFASNLLKFVTSVGIYIAIGMLLVSLLMRLFYKLINHPDYFRWSKRLMLGSVIIAVLSLIIPVVFLGF